MTTKWLWRFLFGPVGRLLPLAAFRALARPLARVVWTTGFRRAVALKNLQMAFPDMGIRQRRRLALRAYRSISTTFLELPALRYMSPERYKQICRFGNTHLISNIGPEGALLLSGHLGNWEMLAVAAGLQAAKPLLVVVKSQRDYGTLALLRSRFGNRLADTASAARQISAALGGGGAVALLADQSTGQDDCPATMFGIPTYTFSAPARLALRYRPRVVIGFAIRQTDGSYFASLSELPHHDLDDSAEGIRIFTQRYVSALEEAVRACPEQWLWTHRKWKHTPGVRY